MGKLEQKKDQLTQALASLDKAINALTHLAKAKKGYNPSMTYEEEYRTHRDSVIQRFEYTIDLFWKYIKKYLEEAHVLSGIKIPGEVIRTAYSLEIINEDEAKSILEMVKSRNLTSHMYVEEIAEELAAEIPQYYKILSTVTQRLESKLT